MSGSTAAHATIASNIATALRRRLRAGGPCKAFVNDMKVRLRIAGEDIFYYPDVLVTCHAIGGKDLFTRFPTVSIEVLSESIELTDRPEKLTHYRQSDTLEEHVLVDPMRRDVTLHRRSENWDALRFTSATASLELDSLGVSLSLTEIHEGVELLSLPVEEARAAARV